MVPGVEEDGARALLIDDGEPQREEAGDRGGAADDPAAAQRGFCESAGQLVSSEDHGSLALADAGLLGDQRLAPAEAVDAADGVEEMLGEIESGCAVVSSLKKSGDEFRVGLGLWSARTGSGAGSGRGPMPCRSGGFLRRSLLVLAL